MCVEKTCTLCGETKPLTEFAKGHKNRNDGYAARCKQCVARYRRELYNGHKTKVNLESRIVRLKQFCEEHNIEIEIKVNNNESKWR